MKNTIYLLLGIIVLLGFQMCTVKSNGNWKSEKNNLELNFSDNWELIIPTLDTYKKTLVGIKDNNDNSSLTVKITDDVSKDQLTDEFYFDAIKEQMLNANSDNKFVIEGKVVFKGIEFHRLIFFMATKFEEMTHTIYTHRNGEKMIGIQFSYPKSLTENPTGSIPMKIEELLTGMKI